jgi:hypothetical protein
MRKTTKTSTKTQTKTGPRRKAITGELRFEINGQEFTLSLNGKVSQTGKTVVFRSSKDDYLESGLGCNIWIDLDLI